MMLALGVLVFDGLYVLCALLVLNGALSGGAERNPVEIVFLLWGGLCAMIATLAYVWPGWAV